jgi:integrase
VFFSRRCSHYLSAINQFCNWAEKNRRLSHNPIASLQRLNAATDVRRKRRALSPDEFSRLLESARSSKTEIQYFAGETRARIYTISYLTGLRRAEIASLTSSSFDLEGNPPTVTLAAGDSKHCKEDVLPLHPELVQMLHKWLTGMTTDQLLLPLLAKRRTWLMVKKDLERAGIPYETEEGFADFHAVGRHTCIIRLLPNGASPDRGPRAGLAQ